MRTCVKPCTLRSLLLTSSRSAQTPSTQPSSKTDTVYSQFLQLQCWCRARRVSAKRRPGVRHAAWPMIRFCFGFEQTLESRRLPSGFWHGFGFWVFGPARSRVSEDGGIGCASASMALRRLDHDPGQSRPPRRARGGSATRPFRQPQRSCLPRRRGGGGASSASKR